MNDKEFNKLMPIATEVFWLPDGDQLPLVNSIIASEAIQFACDSYPRVKLTDTIGRISGEWVPCHNVFKYSDETLQELFKILEAR